MEDRRRLIGPLLGLLVWASGEALAQTPPEPAISAISEAFAAVSASNHAEAERLLTLAAEAPLSPNNTARLLLAELFLRRGEASQAQALLVAVSEDPDPLVAADALTLLGRTHTQQGLLKDAKKAFDAALKKAPSHPCASLRLAQLHELSGKRRLVKPLLSPILDAYTRDKLSRVQDLTCAGVAAQALEFFEDANKIFFQSQDADPLHIDAFLYAGALFLEKYNQRDAADMYQKALAIDPKHPDALIGMARVHLDSDFNLPLSRALAQDALVVNPSHLDALNHLAALALIDDSPALALSFIGRALAANPTHLPALSLKAAAHYLANDAAALSAAEAAILKLNPEYAPLYTTLAFHAEIAHRYDETIGFYKKALALDPGHWRAFQGLGLALTRNGDEAQGLSYLKQAFQHDPYNVRAFNLLELYDKILDTYDTLPLSQGVTLRLPRDEKPLLALYLPALIDQALAVYVAKYQINPPNPLQIELFRDPTQFAVRSVGLPSLSPQGICFGHLITVRSPASGAFNWGQLLWHELAHSFHLGLSKGRVPRWFTEGLAEYETAHARPEWRREHDIPLYLQLRAQTLPSTASLNHAFTSAGSSSELSTAYHLSALTIEFIVETYGFEVIPPMLRAWGDLKDTPSVFLSVLETDQAAFDEAFRAWLSRRLAFLDASYELDLDALFSQHDTWLALAAAAPDDPDALARAGFARLLRRDLDAAHTFSARALQLAPSAILPNYLAAVLYFREGAYEDAEAHFKKLLTLGVDGYTLRCELAALALKLGHPERAIEHYEQAQRLFPSGDEPPRELARLYLLREQPSQALSQLQRLVSLDQSDPQTLSAALDLAIQLSNAPLAMDFAQRALFIDPFDQDLHLKTAALALDASDWSLAERELKAFLLLPHADPFPAHIGLARVYIETRQDTQAQDALRRARAARPSSAELQPLEEMLRRNAP